MLIRLGESASEDAGADEDDLGYETVGLKGGGERERD